jgi:hypothetical protein
MRIADRRILLFALVYDLRVDHIACLAAVFTLASLTSARSGSAFGRRATLCAAR